MINKKLGNKYAMINKKLGNKYAWISFIPLIQLFSYKEAASLSWKKLLGWIFGPFILLIVLWFLSSILMYSSQLSLFNIIDTANAAIGIEQNEQLRGGYNGSLILSLITFIISLLSILIFLLPYIAIKYLISSGISKNTGRGGWSTFGLFLIPFIMLPIIGYKLKSRVENIEENEKL